jgi:hypothetical protein
MCFKLCPALVPLFAGTPSKHMCIICTSCSLDTIRLIHGKTTASCSYICMQENLMYQKLKSGPGKI